MTTRGRIAPAASVLASVSPKIQGLVSAYPSITRIPAQWGDQDAFGHVNNVQYARLMESGRIAWAEHVLRAHMGESLYFDFVSGKGVGTLHILFQVQSLNLCISIIKPLAGFRITVKLPNTSHCSD